MSDPNRIQNIEIIHLGDELLYGLRVNTHLEYLGRMLSHYGVTVSRDLVIRDNREEIIEALHQSWGNTKLLILTGGLGPTVDDITRNAVAEFFGVELVYNENIQKAIEARFSKYSWKITENNFKQCYQLEGSEILENPNGTAPGQWFEKDGRILVMLPGPPRELKPMFENLVIPRLVERELVVRKEPFVQIRTCGIGESTLEEKLQPVMEDNPSVDAAYCVHSGVVDVRFSEAEKGASSAAIKAAEDAQNLLGEDFVGYGEFDMAKSIVRFLTENKQTIAVAESITGGVICSSFVDVPGASNVFAGGAVTYTEEAKINCLGVPEAIIQQHTAVSAETAVAMATGVAEKFSSAYGLSITGYAGPTGGTENDPVGTVYIGYHSPSGAWSKRVALRGDRQTIRQRACVAALDLVRRKQQKYRKEDNEHIS